MNALEIIRGLGSRVVTAVAAACLVLALAAPSQAQYYGYQQGYGGYQPGYGYSGNTGSSYFHNVTSSISNFVNRTFGDGDGEGIGRTVGGAAGIAAGSFGGAALASAVIKSAGIASMGPIAPILVGTAITAGGAFLGAKVLSHGGEWMDQALGPDMTWTLVGGIAGSVAGFALLPALGPFAGPAGRVVGAALGGVAGGILGKIFAPHLQRFATTKTVYGAMGAVIGGAGFGIPGALMGAVGGYALGSLFNKNFFAQPGSSLTGDIQRNVVNYQQPYYDAKYAAGTINNWVRGSTYGAANRLRNTNDYYYDYTQGYPAAYNPAAYAPVNTAALAPSGTGSATVGGSGPVDTSADVATLNAQMRDAFNRYTAAEAAHDQNAASQALSDYNRLKAALNKARGGQ